MTLRPEYSWRITKYNPAIRDEKGLYQKDEWIMFSEIGEAFDDEILTFEQKAGFERRLWLRTQIHFNNLNSF